MKVSTRVVSGYAVFLALLSAVLAYQTVVIHQMRTINRNLSDVSFQAALSSLQLIRDRDLVEEYSKKFFVGRDPDYLERLREYQRDFETTLATMRSKASSANEQAAISLLTGTWQRFNSELDEQLTDPEPSHGAPFPASLDADLDQLTARAAAVHQATLRAIELEVERSRMTGRFSGRVTWSAALGALALSCLVSFFIVRSVLMPLSQLARGTRAVAGGDFSYRLDASKKDEFAQLAADFNTMAHRLDELDQMKRDFVSHVSHEIKSPLASMRETTELLLDGIPGPLTDRQRRLLELHLKSNQRLSSMIGNLLDLSRMEAGVMEYELRNQDLSPLLHSAIAEFEVQARERQIEIKCSVPEEPLVVQCDEDRITQVFANLIGNAVKFSPPSSSIEVHAESMTDIPAGAPSGFRRARFSPSEDSHYALVSIWDSGPGVPDTDKKKIFEKFHQVKLGVKLPGQGVGLGLAICRTIVDAHHGAVWVEDNPRGGSVFRLLLRSGTGGEGVRRGESSPI
jgi:two-component system sensor histidine kinase GlrK